METNIQSAFLKSNSKNLIFYFFNEEANINRDRLTSIKFEIDTTSHAKGNYELVTALFPKPHVIKIYDMHLYFQEKRAVLTRNWKNRVKGRDIFDYDFYLTNKIKINPDYLRQLLINSSLIKKMMFFNKKCLKI